MPFFKPDEISAMSSWLQNGEHIPPNYRGTDFLTDARKKFGFEVI